MSCWPVAGGPPTPLGDFEPFTAEAADAQATVAWLREQDWFNGSLGTIGASYLGFTQWALAADPPPELKAMIVQVSSDNFYNFLYPGGAFALEATLTGVSSMLAQEHGFGATARALLRLARTHKQVAAAYPLLDGYEPAFGRRVPWLEEWLRHPAADDPYWTPRKAGPGLVQAPPVSLLGGWSDVVLDDTLDSYRRLREAGREARLVIGPWNHSSGFNKDMPVVAGEALAFLRARLTGSGEVPGRTPVRVHVCETGQKGEWRDLADWPPPAAKPSEGYPLAGGTPESGGTLGLGAPAGSAQVLRFRYDPNDPTPSVGGPRMDSRGSGPQDNTRLEARHDVLTFTGPVLGEPQEVIGPVSLRLRVKGSCSHFDVFARLCDVDPGGKSWNVCDGIVRLDGGQPADAGGWTEIEVPMSATAHRFGAGHRLRVQVSGGAHPRFARNTGTAAQIATATRLVPVDIELTDAVLSLPGTSC